MLKLIYESTKPGFDVYSSISTQVTIDTVTEEIIVKKAYTMRHIDGKAQTIIHTNHLKPDLDIVQATEPVKENDNPVVSILNDKIWYHFILRMDSEKRYIQCIYENEIILWIDRTGFQNPIEIITDSVCGCLRSSLGVNFAIKNCKILAQEMCDFYERNKAE